MAYKFPLSQLDVIQFDTAGGLGAHAEGKVAWDPNNHTLALYNDEADVTLQVGQEGWIRVYNNSGATITNGKPVYVSGTEATENRPTVALARADAESTSRVIGFATHDIENNTWGYVTAWGLLNDLDTSAFSPGDPLYLDEATAGNLRTTPPPQGNYVVFLGFVVRSDVANGRILVFLNPELGAQVGDAREVVVTALKGSAGTINAGQVVRVTGYNTGQDLVEVELADATASGTMPAFGIAREAITNSASGQLVVLGEVTGLNTASWTVGDALYVDTTAGALTNVKPTGTALVQRFATVTRSHASQGVIEVSGAGRSNDLPNLPSAQLWVGNASGVPAAVAMSGDVSIDNTGATTVVQSSETVSGKIELATQTEVNTGTDAVRAVTPATLFNAEIPATGARRALQWTFSTTTTDSDPGTATFRLNNATQSAATFIYIDDLPDAGVDMGTVLGALAANDRIYIQGSAKARHHLFRVTATPTDGTGYWKIPVASEVAGTAIQNNAKCGFLIFEVGSSGGGEANTASNVGTAGVGLFKQKLGVDLQFKKINAGSNRITITDDTGNDEVDVNVDLGQTWTWTGTVDFSGAGALGTIPAGGVQTSFLPTDNTYVVGSSGNRFASGSAAVAWRIYANQSDTEPTAQLSTQQVRFGPGGVTALDTIITRHGVGNAGIQDGQTWACQNIALRTTGVFNANDGSVRSIKDASFNDEHDNGTSGASMTLNHSNGNHQKVTLGANTAFTLGAPTVGIGKMQVKFIQDGPGNRLPSFVTTVKWPGGTAPTFSTGSGAEDIVSFYYDGAAWYGQYGIGFA